MLSLLVLLKSFRAMTRLGAYAKKTQQLGRSFAGLLEAAEIQVELREHQLNLSKYNDYSRALDPFLLIRVGLDDVVHKQTQAHYCGLYVLLWSEVVELRRWLFIDAYNTNAFVTGECMEPSGFNVHAVLEGGKVRLGDKRIKKTLGQEQNLLSAVRFQKETA